MYIPMGYVGIYMYKTSWIPIQPGSLIYVVRTYGLCIDCIGIVYT